MKIICPLAALPGRRLPGEQLRLRPRLRLQLQAGQGKDPQDRGLSLRGDSEQRGVQKVMCGGHLQVGSFLI